jgi:hypothetical protein
MTRKTSLEGRSDAILKYPSFEGRGKPRVPRPQVSTDVTVVPLQHLGALTSPYEAVREPENEEVVRPQRKRRVDALAGLDFGCSRPFIGHSRTLRWEARFAVRR